MPFSEQVTPGHPDKIADQISDAILDTILTENREAHVAVETLVTGKAIILAGETNHPIDNPATITREIISRAGYTERWWPGIENLQVINLIHQQSENLSQNIQEGAGDQGIMFGYACREKNYLPADYLAATKAARALHQLHIERPDEFGPDGKTTAITDKSGRIIAVAAAILHSIPLDQARQEAETCLRAALDIDCPITINTSGEFTIGGPVADTGLTGRKIIADTYGGRGRHGGGAFSGKDASKVDRTGAYYARHLAIKTLEATPSAYEAEVQIGYSIGDLMPRHIAVRTDGDICRESVLGELFSPREAAETFNLLSPIYSESTCFGHFTDISKPWNHG